MNNLQVWHSFSDIYELFVQLERRLLLQPQGCGRYVRGPQINWLLEGPNLKNEGVNTCFQPGR